jgi:hypothetical protein
LLDSGQVSNRAALTKRFGCSRVRVTQVLDLLHIHSRIIEHIEAGEGATERALRPLAGMPLDRQVEAARGALKGFEEGGG